MLPQSIVVLCWRVVTLCVDMGVMGSLQPCPPQPSCCCPYAQHPLEKGLWGAGSEALPVLRKPRMVATHWALLLGVPVN